MTRRTHESMLQSPERRHLPPTAVILAGSLALGLSGCGGENNPSKSSERPATISSSATHEQLDTVGEYAAATAPQAIREVYLKGGEAAVEKAFEIRSDMFKTPEEYVQMLAKGLTNVYMSGLTPEDKSEYPDSDADDFDFEAAITEKYANPAIEALYGKGKVFNTAMLNATDPSWNYYIKHQGKKQGFGTNTYRSSDGTTKPIPPYAAHLDIDGTIAITNKKMVSGFECFDARVPLRMKDNYNKDNAMFMTIGDPGEAVNVSTVATVTGVCADERGVVRPTRVVMTDQELPSGK